MKLESKFFDTIRVAGRGKRNRRNRWTSSGAPAICDHFGCNKPGIHRAPRGHDEGKGSYQFCVEHAREYNQSYDFFSGMGESERSAFYVADSIGHRPTWSTRDILGGDPATAAEGAHVSSSRFTRVRVPGNAGAEGRARQQSPARAPNPVEVRSLESLGLSHAATTGEIRARFKSLVKRFHPDLNGGNKDLETRLKSVLRAYSHLKRTGRV